jgi:hypothetical protein
MTIRVVGVMVVLAGRSVQGGEAGPARNRSVTIWVQPSADLAFGIAEQQARPITARMFADIGVGIKWRDGLRSCPADGIRISFSSDAPRDMRPGALAYALPYEGTHIEVFSDRVKQTVQPNRVPSLLAHVLAHEITHVLQGIVRHSGSGVMKASWDESDYCQMAWKPLPFTELDVHLIHRGIDGRALSPPR